MDNPSIDVSEEDSIFCILGVLVVGRFYRYWLNDCLLTLTIRRFLVLRLCTLIINYRFTWQWWRHIDVLKNGVPNRGAVVVFILFWFSFTCFVCCQKVSHEVFPFFKNGGLMAILCRTPSRGAVEYARRTAVISYSLVRWNTYMVEGFFIPGIFRSWM